MKPERPNSLVILMLLCLSFVVTFFEVLYKGIGAILTGKMIPLRQTRLLRIWHWVALDGPRRFWQSPSRYHFFRSPATLLEVIFAPKIVSSPVLNTKKQK